MMKFWRNRGASRAISSISKAVVSVFEPLESRQLLSASWGQGPIVAGPIRGRFPGGADNTIAFSLAPTAVQTGLDSLATADGLTDPTSTQLVTLGNSNGVETYSVTLDGTGTVSKLTVDQLGDPVTAPTESTTTWSTLSGTGTGSDSAAATEITAIATALDLNAPASTDTVHVTQTSSGAVTYSIQLTANTSTSTTAGDWRGNFNFGTTVSVDAAGNPVGNQQLPFSVFSSTLQNALNAHAPSGATALTSTSTQNVDVRTTDGVVTYSTKFSVTGIQTTVTVNSSGALTSLPTTTTTTFSALSSKVQTELQTLATADGVTATIAANQSINVLTETNGTIIYSATLSASKTGSIGNTFSFDVTIAVDSNGNPTVPPQGGFGFAGYGVNPGGINDPLPPITNGGGTTNSSGGTTNSSSGTSVSLPSSGTSTASSSTVSAADSLTSGTYLLSAKLLAEVTQGLTMLDGYFAEFTPPALSSTVKADLVTLGIDALTLAGDVKGLSKSEKATFATDTKAQASAIKAMSSTLAPLEATLKSDAKTWAATLKKDQQAVHKDAKNATALAAAKAQLASDESSAFTAIVKDEGAILSAVDSNSGVIADQDKLASDLPTIGSDESAIETALRQLVSDV